MCLLLTLPACVVHQHLQIFFTPDTECRAQLSSLSLGEGDHWTLSGNAGWWKKQWGPSHALFLLKCLYSWAVSSWIFSVTTSWVRRQTHANIFLSPSLPLLIRGSWLENFFFFFFLSLTICGMLVPPPGLEPDTALEAQSLNHWTSREISTGKILKPPAFNPFKLTIVYNY